MDRLFDKPTALTIGPHQCGTGWIYDYLKSRGDVCLPAEVREIFYFDRHFQRGPDFYASHFRPLPPHRLIIEPTTTAFDNPDAPDRVFQLLGADVRLVCPLRHPVERARAVYLDYLKYGLVRGGIEQAVEEAPQIIFGSRYSDHLERWFRQFGRNNIHVVFYETLQHDPQLYARGLCRILDLPFMPPAGEGWLARLRKSLTGPAPVPASLEKADESWLKSRLQLEISRLESLLNQPLTVWKT